MRTNTKAVVTGDKLGVHKGTGALWELAVIIHLQICFEFGGTVEKRQVLDKVYGAESAFLILISDLYDPVGPPLVLGFAELVPEQL